MKLKIRLEGRIPAGVKLSRLFHVWYSYTKVVVKGIQQVNAPDDGKPKQI